jgi:glycerophosphoryl diester phosphodiesterase
MKFWLSWIGFALALILLAVTTFNASWLADPPRGVIRLIAHRGVAQLYDHQGIGRDSCTAMRIEPPVHDYLENTIRSIDAAWRMGADMVEIDVAPTADGKMAVFHDWTLDCRTDGKGNVRDATMAELKRLDPGYGYTEDGGKTFPLRGTQVGAIPSLREVLHAFPGIPLLYNFKSKDPAEADLLARELAAAGRDPVARGDGFYGAAAPVERIRRLYPKAWAWSMDGAKACTKSYIKTGWTGRVPESCRNGAIFVPLNYQWAFWGWPNRLIDRMNRVGARVIVIGPRGGEAGTGLTLPEQIGDVPSTFKGYLWVEDIWTVGPAFRPEREIRSNAQIAAAEAALERRRARP